MLKSNQNGQILIITIVFLAVVSTLVIALIGYSAVQIKSHRQAVAREQAINIAEGGLEKALWKLNNQSGYSGETGTVLGAGTYNVAITNLSGSTKLIRADAFVPNSTNPIAKRTVQITASIGTTNLSFNYGVQVGQGGLNMSNNSRIIGNIYSNGNIVGANSARIQGSAIVSGITGKIDDIDIDGNANAHFIEDATVGGNTESYSLVNSTVGGNVTGTTISSCTVGGNAIYDTKISCTIGGTQTTPNPNNFPDPDATSLPISDEQVAAWEQEAEAGGAITSQSYSSGTINLGPKKINGNLTVSNSATLNITGTLWVTGQITFSNSATIKLDSSFGSQSGVLVAGTAGSSTAGLIDLNNSVQIQGSGTAGSYLLLLSQRNTTASIAIDAGNSGTASILYAGYGLININNSGQFKEITAAKISISNSATVTYESGLANVNFSSGPSGGWEILDQTWQLLQ